MFYVITPIHAHKPFARLNRVWPAVLAVVVVLLLFTGAASAQTDPAQLTVSACQDQNADGQCSPGEAELTGVAACLDEATCQPAPAIFTNLAAGIYTPFLRFGGSTLGYYPTTPRLPITLAAGQSLAAQLGAVYPVHPKGVAVHPALNKVYVAFQGPVVNGLKPYPFVAVIDGATDQVLRTIPGGENGSAPGAPNGMGIGREPWGVAVPNNGAFVYVGSYGDGIITIIDPVSDTVITSISPGAPFKPTAPAVNPVTGKVSFPDYVGGRVVVINDDPTTFPTQPILNIIPVNNYPNSYSPFEMAIAATLESYSFVTLRDAAAPHAFKFVGFNPAAFTHDYYDIWFNTPTGQATGIPHAMGLWQEGNVSRLFITYAKDPRAGGVDYPNPNQLLVYDFSAINPSAISLRRAKVAVGDYAEVGLVYNPLAGHMLGTYAGFPYIDTQGDEAACNNPTRGGTYALDIEGNVLNGDAAGVWRLPNRAVGNPPFSASGLGWRNPFEIAVNPNNNKVYVTDRCWNDYPTGGHPGGGAVLIFEDTAVGPTPTPTVTGTPPTETPTVTGTPPTETPTVTGTPPTATVTGTPPTETPTTTGTPPTETPTVTGTPPTATVTGTPSTATPTVTGTPPTATVTGTPPTATVTGTPPTETPTITGTPDTATPTVTPDIPPMTLAFNGPAGVNAGDTFNVAVQAQGVGGLGLYGVQLEVNYDPTQISAANLQVNPDLNFVVLNTIDNTVGKIRYLASRQGRVPGLTGDITLLTFDATAINAAGQATFSFSKERVGDPLARPFRVITQTLTVIIQIVPITPTGTPGTETPTVTGTPPTATVTGTPPTATVTGTPPTATVTGTPPTATVTGTPPTATVTGTPPTATPTVTGTPPTATVTGTPPTATVTGTPPTATITGTPPTATVTGTPPTATVTGTPPTATPTVTGTPPTATVTGTPPTATVTGTPPTATPTPEGDLTMSGLVYDAFGGRTQVISNAQVSVLTCQPRRLQTVSQADGLYSLLLPGIYLNPCVEITIEVIATGYNSLLLPLTVADLRGQPHRDFALVPLVTPTPTPSTGTPGTPTITGTPGTPTKTNTPGTPTITGTPGTPGTPTITGTPGTPTKTSTPGTPTVTGTPGTPTKTSTPGTPTVTGTPGTPTVTGTPGTPTKTSTPGTPTVTGTPGTPTVTGTPGTPTKTSTPGTPTVTGTPGTPTKTSTPGTPTVTGTPGTPTVTGTPGTPTPGITVVVTLTGTPGTPAVTGTPGTPTPGITPGVTVVVTTTTTPTPSGLIVVIMLGQVSLPGRTANDWSGATIAVEENQMVQAMANGQTTTDKTGNFALTAELPTGNAFIKADAPGYLPAVCNTVITQPQASLSNVALRSGDINDDDRVDITDAVAIGRGFGQRGADVPSDINRSGHVDVLDVILVGINFGEGAQPWSCLGQ